MDFFVGSPPNDWVRDGIAILQRELSNVADLRRGAFTLVFNQFRTMWQPTPPAVVAPRRPIPPPALRGLPLGNLLETNQLLVQSMDALIASQRMFEPEQRLRHLIAFEPALSNVYELLATHYSQLTNPLDAGTWELAELQRRLYWSLAQGYKSVIADLLPRKLSRRSAGVVTISLSKALKALARVLSTSCRFYLDPPRGMWADLHQLYRLAERCNYTSLDPTVVTDLDTPIQDPTRVYKKAMLFWLADPYQMTTQERDQLGRLIDIIQEHCHLFRPQEMSGDMPMHYVVLNGDNPPVFARPSEPLSLADTRIIDTTVLVSLLQQHLSLGQENDLTGLRLSSIHPQIRQRALRAWRHDYQRVQARHRCAHNIHITVGLNATHYIAQNRRLILDPYDTAKHAPDIPLEKGRRKKKKPPAPSRSPHESFRGQMIDQSPRGGCIVGIANPALRLQVGDVIGIFHGQDGQPVHLTLAVVRWIKNSDGSNISFGIEFVANEPTPVMARVCNKGTAQSDYLRSFLLAGSSKTSSPTTLLTARAPFKAGDQVGVNWNEHDTLITLHVEITATSRFARFVFETVKSSNAVT